MTEPKSFHNGRVVLHGGDCLEILKTLPDNSLDSCVCDPPYHLTSIVKRFGGNNAAAAQQGTDGLYARASAGFMGKQWDGGDIAFRVELWAQVLRVLKPGGHLVAFSGTRTYHRMATAIEDAGFDVRDMLSWIFGSGFPKSHNIGAGLGTALKPAHEPVCFARKPLSEKTVAANVLAHGTGAINVDACRVGEFVNDTPTGTDRYNAMLHAQGYRPNAYQREGEPSAERSYEDTGSTNFAMKPGPRGGAPSGRWPANVIHDGSDEVVSAFPDTISGSIAAHHVRTTSKTKSVYGERAAPPEVTNGDSGSAARFFYSAKADADDRIGSKHPTVKPVDLMRWLCRLVTPKGGTVLDMFAGTGTTGAAAYLEGFNAVLIERETEYQADIARRMALLLAGPDEKANASIKARGKLESADSLPLFGGGGA